MYSDPMTASCFCCGKKLYFAPDSDAGHVIERYGIVVCSDCFAANVRGWNRNCETRVLDHLQRSRLAPPPRNAHGRLPRE